MSGETTALALISDDGVDLRERLTAAAPLSPAAGRLEKLESALWDTAYDELTDLVCGFLQADVAAVVQEGLRRAKELIDAARRTRFTDDRAVVQLSDRTFTLVEHPTVDLVCGHKRVLSMPFTLTLSATVTGLDAVVRHARVVELTSGRIEASVTLDCGADRLASGSRTLPASVSLDLGEGWPLLVGLPSAG